MKRERMVLGILNLIASLIMVAISIYIILNWFTEEFLSIPLLLVAVYDLTVGVLTMKNKHRGWVVAAVVGIFVTVVACVFFAWYYLLRLL